MEHDTFEPAASYNMIDFVCGSPWNSADATIDEPRITQPSIKSPSTEIRVALMMIVRGETGREAMASAAAVAAARALRCGKSAALEEKLAATPSAAALASPVPVSCVRTSVELACLRTVKLCLMSK